MKKIFIVNKNIEDIKKISTYLRAKDHEIKVYFSEDIESAVKLIININPEYIITTFTLIDSDGKNLIQRINSDTFKFIIYEDDKFYEIVGGDMTNPQGYLLKEIDKFD